MMESLAIATAPEAAAEAPARMPLALFRLGDERLARLVARGNERAFALLYERYHQPLYRYLRSLLGQDADAQDALQLTFASAFGALSTGRRDAPLKPWLYRIAHNHAISTLRRRRPQDELTDGLVSRAPLPEDQAAERERLACLVADLRELSDRQRAALVMRELSGLSHEDIACALEISVGAAKQTVFEARRGLTEFAEGRAMACEDVQRVISDGDKRALRGRRVRGHLRSCPTCAAFRASIQTRRADLLALSPALPAVAASALFARVTGGLGSGGVSGGVSGGGGGGLLAGATGKTAGVAVSGKLFAAGVVVVATTTAGAAGVLPQITGGHGSARSETRTSIERRSAAGGSSAPGSAAAPLRRGGYVGGAVLAPTVGVPGSASSARAISTASGGGVRSARSGFSPPGRSVSQSAGAGARGNSATHSKAGRSTSSTNARGWGAGGSQPPPGSTGATHRASKPAGGSAQGADSVSAARPRRKVQLGRVKPGVLSRSNAPRVGGARSLASSGAAIPLPAAGRTK